jgi:hypothetical protein
LAVSGCDDTKGPDPEKTAKSEEGSAKAEKAVAEAVGEAEAQAEKQVGKVFDKDALPKACDLLTPKLASELLGFPESELKQQKIMGCMYRREVDGQFATVQLLQMQAFKQEKITKRWYENWTKSKSAEVAAADAKKVGKQLDEKLAESEEIDTKPGKVAAKAVTGLVEQATSGAVAYTPIPKLGDEAHSSDKDGTVYVRVGNLIFQTVAYSGPSEPTPEMKPDPKNMDPYLAEVMRVRKAWIRDTAPQRAALAEKVARAVVEQL